MNGDEPTPSQGDGVGSPRSSICRTDRRKRPTEGNVSRPTRTRVDSLLVRVPALAEKSLGGTPYC